MEEDLFNSATLKDGFAGNRKYLKGFLAKINLIFMLYPDLDVNNHNNDESKIIMSTTPLMDKYIASIFVEIDGVKYLRDKDQLRRSSNKFCFCGR